nr:unnamed protein product [Callosobruchus chinensis]
MANRNREGNMDEDSDIDDNKENSQDGQIQEAEDLEQQTIDYTDDTAQQMISETTKSNLGAACSSVTKNKNISKGSVKEDQSSPIRKAKRAKKIQKEPSNYENIDEERTYDIKELEEGSELPDDHLYHFFMSMYRITKKMPFAHQYALRNEVYNAVSTMEAKCFGFQSHQYQPRETSSLYLYRKSESPQSFASYPSSTSPIPSPNCDTKDQLEVDQEFLTVLVEVLMKKMLRSTRIKMIQIIS